MTVDVVFGAVVPGVTVMPLLLLLPLPFPLLFFAITNVADHTKCQCSKVSQLHGVKFAGMMLMQPLLPLSLEIERIKSILILYGSLPVMAAIAVRIKVVSIGHF